MSEVYESHRELFHYTNWKGLKGIVSSQQLWATHFRHLNDATEVEHLKEYLCSEVALAFEDRLSRNKEPRIVRAVRQHGGARALAAYETGLIVDQMYRVAFVGSANAAALAVPFICSFCSHALATDYERTHGLLSQWRSYGGEAGFALVFDARRLEDLLKKEFAENAYQARIFEPVIYNEGDDSFRRDLGELVRLLEEFMVTFLVEGQNQGPSGELTTQFLISATTVKHRGFKEESEVRVAMCRTPPDSREKMRVSKPDDPFLKKPMKQVHNRGEGEDLFYIKLFEFREQPLLPINRIVVGPHRNQSALKEQVLQLVQGKILVSCSETPYVGRLQIPK